MLGFDYHTHHHRCGHAIGNIHDYCEAALSIGMTTVGISDHGPAYWLDGDHAQPQTQMACSAVTGYVAEALNEQKYFAGRMDVRVGLEADWIPGRTSDLMDLLDNHPFDYVLGSVHYILGRSIFARARWEHEDASTVYRAYYEELCRAAQSGLFDIMSHLTAVEAYGPPIDPMLAGHLYPMVAAAIKESGCVVELNTSGYRKRPNDDDPFPNKQLLSELITRRVPLTFGSDCHAPHEVGFGAERILALLETYGIDSSSTTTTVKRGPIRTFSYR
jgi:histidinol-phosphatase (PHP family)